MVLEMFLFDRMVSTGTEVEVQRETGLAASKEYASFGWLLRITLLIECFKGNFSCCA